MNRTGRGVKKIIVDNHNVLSTLNMISLFGRRDVYVTTRFVRIIRPWYSRETTRLKMKL